MLLKACENYRIGLKNGKFYISRLCSIWFQRSKKNYFESGSKDQENTVWELNVILKWTVM